jgi:hypothetical protein
MLQPGGRILRKQGAVALYMRYAYVHKPADYECIDYIQTAERTASMSRTMIEKISTAPGKTAASAKGSRPSRPGARPSADSFTLADRVYLKFGRFGTTVIHRLVSVALVALVLVADYLLVLFTAVNVLPNIAVLIQQGTGVTLNARLDMVIAGWLIPVLFIVAAVLVAEIFLMRRLWRAATGLSRTLGRALFALDPHKQMAAHS